MELGYFYWGLNVCYGTSKCVLMLLGYFYRGFNVVGVLLYMFQCRYGTSIGV